MESACIDCGTPVARSGSRGPIPSLCPEHRRQRKNASRRRRYYADPAAAIAASIAWRKANPERRKATAAAWYEANRDQQNARRKEWAEANPGRDWGAYTQRKYNLSLEGYNALLDAQGGTCAIPGCLETEGRAGQPLQVDHDHACCPGTSSCGECIRGLLCGRHNAGLGLFRDGIETLRAAADYLETRRVAS